MCVCARALVRVCTFLQSRWVEVSRGGEPFLQAPFWHSHHSDFTHREEKENEA